MKQRFFSVFVAIVIAGAFWAGVLTPELRAHGGLPEVFSSLRPNGSGRDLDPINTYTKVLELVNEKFYGEVLPPRKMTHFAIRGMLSSLDDPYTRFLDPEEYRALREENM